MTLKAFLADFAVFGMVIVVGWSAPQTQPDSPAASSGPAAPGQPARLNAGTREPAIELTPAAREKGGIVTAALRIATDQPQRLAYSIVLSPSNLVELRQTYIAADAQVHKTKADLGVAEEEYQRAKLLYGKSQNVSQQTLQVAEGNRQAAMALARAAEESLRAAEETARQRWGAVLTGWMTNDAPEFQRLVRQEDLLLQLTTPRRPALLSPPATALAEAADGTWLPAQFVSAAPVTDPRIQGQSFYYTVKRSGGLLPGMSLTAHLPVGEPVQGVVVPYSAVVWWQGLAWAFFQRDPQHFVRRPVFVDQPRPGGWFQAAPFSAREAVVVTGAQWLLTVEMGAGAALGD